MPSRTVAAAVGLTLLSVAGQVAALPIPWSGRKGVLTARKGDCVAAVPMLEKSELESHSPVVSVELARCYIKTGRLRDATDLFRATAEEAVTPQHSGADRAAMAQAKDELPDVESRLGRILFDASGAPPDVVVLIDGVEVEDLDNPRPLEPGIAVAVRVEAEGYVPLEEELVLGEGEEQILSLRLDKVGKEPASKPKKAPEKSGPDDGPYVGARFRGILIPKFVMNFFVDGGTNVFAPGGDITLTLPTDDGPDVRIALGYNYFGMGDTPIKDKGAPDTEWEIVSSNLQTLYLQLELAWEFALTDDEALRFRLGGGAGVGYAFVGDLNRNQAYPPPGTRDDPYQWERCNGPNDPAGTFRYCNELDKDADRYGDYSEPNWFQGGSRPLIFPQVTLPQLGLSWHVTEGTVLELETGLSLNGVMTAAGVRFDVAR